MATDTNSGTNASTYSGNSSPVVRMEDLIPVRSRVSWGAILAGSVLSLALYFLLTLLGGAIGLSISGNTNFSTLSVGAAVWAIVITSVCLFVGGFTASQLTTGENRQEAIVYGLLVWAVVFAMLLWLMATGVRAGFNAMVGVATAGAAVGDATARNTSQQDLEQAARRFGFTQEQINEARQRVREAPERIREAADDPATRQRAEETAREAGEAATRVTWFTFFGTLISMFAAMLGGFMGAGPTFRLLGVA
jgi:methyl-accepting chemotaxis protein